MKKFSPHVKPYPLPAPRKPLKTVNTRVECGNFCMGDDSTNKLEDLLKAIPTDATHYSVILSSSDYQSKANLTFFRYDEVPNPGYDTEMKNYEKRLEAHKIELAEHKQKLKEWNAQKKIYDKEQEEKGLKYRRSMYEKLKKEFN